MDQSEAERAEPQADGARSNYLTFFIGSEEYGVPILRVREIIQLGTITRVPAAPLCVRGVINLRGAVVPVADLAIKFGQPECVATRFTCVVVVEVSMDDELTVMGLMVDSVNQTVELGEEDIEPVPNFGTLAPSEFLVGMGKQDRKFILLLDIDRALSAAELRQAASVAPEAGDAGEEAPADAALSVPEDSTEGDAVEA